MLFPEPVSDAKRYRRQSGASDGDVDFSSCISVEKMCDGGVKRCFRDKDWIGDGLASDPKTSCTD
jgi:hypothetical protein